MNLSSIEKIISHKQYHLKKTEYNRELLEEIRKCVINNIFIKVNMNEMIYLIIINYELTKVMFADYLVKIINDNGIDKQLLLKKLVD